MASDFLTYAVLAGNDVIANSGESKIEGRLGYVNSLLGPGTVVVTDETVVGVLVSTALTSASTTYNNFLAVEPSTVVVTSEIGGTIINPGVTRFTNIVGVTIGTTPGNNTVTFNGDGLYVLQIPNGNLATDTSLAPVFFNFINGAKASNIYWLVNGSVDLQTVGNNITTFSGLVISQGNITMGTNSIASGGLISINGDITLNSNTVTSNNLQKSLENIYSGYINLETSLADSSAIRINASNPNGGIDIDAGFGGIAIDTTNSVNITAASASSMVVTGLGNLTYQARLGLVNIDGVNGINIGSDATFQTPIINIGTHNSNKDITIGNQNGTTSVDIHSGTGGLNVLSSGTISLNGVGASNFTSATNSDSQDLIFGLTGNTNSSIILSSQGNGADSISLLTSNNGGFTGAIDGKINLVSSDSGPDAIKLDCGFGGGGIQLTAGNNGIGLDAYNGGATNGGLVLTSGAAGIGINAFNGGVIGIGNSSNGEILIGTASLSRTITLGNQTSTTSLVERWGPSGGIIQTQYPEIAFGNVIADTPITGTSQLLAKILTIDPTVSSNLIMPTASDVVSTLNSLSGIPGANVNDSIDFTIINLSLLEIITLVTNGADSGNTFIGSMSVSAQTSATFRLRVINIAGGSEAYTIYRLA